jgi:hypothetical protein
MTKDDVLFGYRLQLFDLAGRTNVSHACRVFGIHRSTYYAWKAQVDQGGLEMLRPKERRPRRCPTSCLEVTHVVGVFQPSHPIGGWLGLKLQPQTDKAARTGEPLVRALAQAGTYGGLS